MFISIFQKFEFIIYHIIIKNKIISSEVELYEISFKINISYGINFLNTMKILDLGKGERRLKSLNKNNAFFNDDSKYQFLLTMEKKFEK